MTEITRPDGTHTGSIPWDAAPAALPLQSAPEPQLTAAQSVPTPETAVR